MQITKEYEKKMSNNQQPPSGFKELLNKMMSRRWYITAMVLGGFILIIGGIFTAISLQTPMAAAWKELLMLLLGAFIGSYGKIIDYSKYRDFYLTYSYRSYYLFRGLG